LGLKERKDREKENRRDEILKAGERLFIVKGIAVTTMDEIARECELAKGTLYLYFKSKEQLYLEIVLRAVTIMCDMAVASQEGVSDPVRRLAKIGESQQRFYSEFPDLFMLVSRISAHELVSMEGAGETAHRLHEKNIEIWTLVNEIIADGIRRGVFRDDTDPMEISVGLHAITMAVTIMMDQSKRMSEKSGGEVDIGIPRDKLKTIMDRCCGRLIMTILKDPSQYKDFR
jgi:AcrR family transcriptional regulator